MLIKPRRLFLQTAAFLTVAAFLVALVPPAGAQGSWWNRDWTKRVRLTISPNSSGNIVVYVPYLSGMQPDFDDIRFLEDENGGELQYFRENYRLGQDAVFIVSRPSSSDDTIYMYFGNPNVGTTSLTWSGNIIFYATSLSPGWTRLSALDGRFPQGSSSYGATGGSSSHSHTFSGTTSTASVPSLGRPDTGSSSLSYAYYNHYHTFSGSTSTVTHLPPYLTVIFESSSSIPREVDSTFIAMFTSLPSGWSYFSAMEGRFPYGGSSYGATGGSETHTHSVSFTTGGPSNTITYTDARSGTDQERTTSTHTHSYSGNVSGSNLPPYLNMIFANPTSTSLLPNGIIVMFDTLPPLGWTRFTALDGKFPRGSSSYGETGGSATHSHTISGTTSGASAYVSDFRSSYNPSGPCFAHTHSFSVTTSSASNIPPYFTVIFGQRNVSSSSVIFGSVETFPNPPTSLLCQGQTNPAKLTTLTPYFSAIHTDNNGYSANKYRIQVTTDPTFASITHWDSGAAGTSMAETANNTRCPNITYAGATLSRGVTYYWRIKFWNSIGIESEWSTENTYFKINSLPATSNLKINNLTSPARLPSTTTTVTFSWSYSDADGDSQAKYEILVGMSSGSSDKWNSGQVSSSATSVTYAGSSLSPGVTYYVQVRTFDNYEWSDWATGAFMINRIPTAPTALSLSPTTAKVGQTLTATASGSTDPDGDTITYYYRFYNQTEGVVRRDWSTSNTYTIAVADAHDNIRVFVKAWDGYEFGPEFENSIIVANTESTTSNLLTQGQTNPTHLTTFTPTFSWSYSDADGDSQKKYQIYVGTTSGGYDMWNSGQVSSSSTSATYAGSALSRGVTYYVQVRTYDGYEWSSWVTGTFRINQLPVSLNPRAENQTNPTRLVTFTPALSWTFSDEDGDTQAKYQIQVGTSEGDNSKWDTTVSSSATSVVYGGSALSRGVTYYWRVRAFDGYEWSDWAMGTFRLNQTSGLTGLAASALCEVYLYNYGSQDVLVDRLFVQGAEVFGFKIKDAETGAECSSIPANRLVKIVFPSPSEGEFYITIVTRYKGVFSWRVVL